MPFLESLDALIESPEARQDPSSRAEQRQREAARAQALEADADRRGAEPCSTSTAAAARLAAATPRRGRGSPDAVLAACERSTASLPAVLPARRGPRSASRSRALAAAATKHRATPAQIAIAWLLARSPASCSPSRHQLASTHLRGELGRAHDQVVARRDRVARLGQQRVAATPATAQQIAVVPSARLRNRRRGGAHGARRGLGATGRHRLSREHRDQQIRERLRDPAPDLGWMGRRRLDPTTRQLEVGAIGNGDCLEHHPILSGRRASRMSVAGVDLAADHLLRRAA